MSRLTQDLLPGNILDTLKSMEKRVRVLETALARAQAAGDNREFYVYDPNGVPYRLTVDYIDGVPTLWLEEAGGGGG